MEIPIVGIAISSLIAFLIAAYLANWASGKWGPLAS